jgi:hypothetical protein
MSEEQLSGQEQSKPRAWLIFDRPGHEGEYVFNIDLNMNPQNVPFELQEKIEQELGSGWFVESRSGGSHLEICNRTRTRDDEKVIEAVRRILGAEYEFHDQI